MAKAGTGMKSAREDISSVYRPVGKTSTYARTYLTGIIRGVCTRDQRETRLSG